jgi:DNA-binding NarL/FixJ family response regulator
MHRGVGDTMAPMASAAPRPRVVLADDHAAVLHALGRLLAQSCDVLATVSTGAEAVDTVLRLEPDVVVVDLMLPDIDGLEVCRRIKAQSAETAVVIITASDDAAIKTAAARDGVAAFVPKHLAAEKLAETVARVFAGAARPG